MLRGLGDPARVVRGDADGGAVGMQLREHLHQRLPRLRIEVAGRFVRQEHGRTAGDRACDGDELLMGEGSVFLRGLHAYRPDGIPVWSHALPSFGLHALASGDLDADGAAEILLAGGVHSTGPDLLRILDGQTRATRFELNDEEGPHSSVAQADFDGDGAQELALLTRDSKSPFGGPRLVVLDAATGAELRRSADGFFAGDLPSGADLHVAQMDADAALELVIGARGVYDGLVRVVDGVTLALQWEQTFSYEGDTAIELLPTAGGAPEVVAMTGRRL